ncbi:hypothetical protein GlitD10_1141 [Gloeomargarita lithophora Alchichica-D10]|uniref:Uncharacterized protein n=1 Tax=Gloeomargarita lithophora Alchichica-D10 TaxID=1188229 RepID=A0A1J0AC11_9CYAN|nr:hypothetical protein [Gloeomargarita lithophora]APB33461.1 hypothetical protein GlitD10_1141 [Gloeomargarita lithophora Alchichica-D10]
MLQAGSPSLNVGNILTFSLQVYGRHFWRYLWLSLQAYAWALVPVYGWAKYSALMGALSRLVVQQLRGVTESPLQAVTVAQGKMWGLLGAGMLYGLVSAGALVVIGGAGLLLTVPLALRLEGLEAWENPWIGLGFVLWAGVVAVGALVAWTWLVFRWLLYPLPLVLEPGVGPLRSLPRSWHLTQGAVVKIQLVVLIGGLLLLPFQLPVQMVMNMVQMMLLVFATLIGGIVSVILAAIVGEPAVAGIGFLVPMVFAFLIPAFLVGAVFAPFWQAVLGALYYESQCQREGWGLVLPSLDP